VGFWWWIEKLVVLYVADGLGSYICQDNHAPKSLAETSYRCKNPSKTGFCVASPSDRQGCTGPVRQGEVAVTRSRELQAAWLTRQDGMLAIKYHETSSNKSQLILENIERGICMGFLEIMGETEGIEII
jgi:hypothetical protein